MFTFRVEKWGKWKLSAFQKSERELFQGYVKLKFGKFGQEVMEIFAKIDNESDNFSRLIDLSIKKLKSLFQQLHNYKKYNIHKKFNHGW